MTTFAVELLAHSQAELEDILPQHWEEIARDRDTIKLDPDWPAYHALEACGQLHFLVCRVDGKMAGYHLAFVRPHLHYRQSLSCITDIFYLKPEYRKGGIGKQLFVESEKVLKARGVQKVFLGCKVALDLTPLFENLGYQKIEYVFAKVLA